MSRVAPERRPERHRRTRLAALLGFLGLNLATFDAPHTLAVDIRWRLARAYCGNELATQAAQAVLDYGFENLNRDEIVSFTLRPFGASTRTPSPPPRPLPDCTAELGDEEVELLTTLRSGTQ